MMIDIDNMTFEECKELHRDLWKRISEIKNDEQPRELKQCDAVLGMIKDGIICKAPISDCFLCHYTEFDHTCYLCPAIWSESFGNCFGKGINYKYSNPTLIENIKFKKRILIVIDMQNDFVSGPLGTKEAKEIIPTVKERIRFYENNVVFTQDTHGLNYLNTMEGYKLPVEHCLKGTNGWKVVDELDIPEAKHIEKTTFGYMDWDFLENYDSIELAGVCSEICVISNALILKAKFPKKQIIVDGRCCAGSTPEKHEEALSIMESCQIDVIR